MQMTSKQEWRTPGTLPLDDSVLREKIYQRTGYKYAYSPHLIWVDYSALSAPRRTGNSHCTVDSGGALSVLRQLDLLYRLNSKAIQDPTALEDLDCDTVLRKKIYNIIGNKYAYSPTAHNISLNWVDYSALSTPSRTGNSHCTVDSGGALSVLRQLDLLNRLNSKAIQDPTALEDLDCDTVLREKIYNIIGNKYAYSPTPHHISFSCVDYGIEHISMGYSALRAPCTTGSNHCTVGSGGPLSVLNQLDLLYRLNSKAIQDLPALGDLDCDTVLREKVYKVAGNKYAYSPTPHNISFSCLDYSIEHISMDCSALSAACNTGSSHFIVGSGGPLSDLDQWEPFISIDPKVIEDLLAVEESLAQTNSTTVETATALAPVTFGQGLASCFPYEHFLVSANEWQDWKNNWKPIFTIDSHVVEKCSTLILTQAVNLTTIHLCVALPDCTLSVLLTRLHEGFRATGKRCFRAGGQKLASQIIAWVHQLKGNTFASSATAHNSSITWLNHSSQNASNCIPSRSQDVESSVGQLAGSYQVDSSNIFILTRPVQLAISQLTLALQVCNLSGLFTKRHGNVVPIGQLLKAKTLSQVMSAMTSLQDIRVIPSFRTRKALQLASGTASINISAQLSVDITGHRGNENNTAPSMAEKSLFPHKDCSSTKEEATNPRGEAALRVDENVLPENNDSSNEKDVLSIYGSVLLPSVREKKKTPTGCFKWLWGWKKKTALHVDEKVLPENNDSSNEQDVLSIYGSVLPPSVREKKTPTGCFKWLWGSKKKTTNSVAKKFNIPDKVCHSVC